MSTVFVQFYSRIVDPFSYSLGNGFSDTYDFCKNIGDIIWIYHDKDIETDKYDTNEDLTEFPINEGTAYISALYTTHLYRTYLWAKRYPNVNFIIGGPIVTCNFSSVEMPSNLKLYEGSIEKYFGIEDFSYPWKIDIPIEIPSNDVVYTTYTLDNYCYWANCIFCAFSEDRHAPNIRKRKQMNFEFKDINYNGELIIRLNTEAISPSMIKKTFPPLSNLSSISKIGRYKIFMRPAIGELNALKTIEKFPEVEFNLGLEYPNKRMWEYMRKGYNKTDVVEMFKFLTEKNLPSCSTLIFGWNNLIEQDLIDLEDFLKSLPDEMNKVAFKFHKLIAFNDTQVSKTYKRGKEIRVGPFFIGFYPKLSEKQLDLNRRSKEIVSNYAIEKGIYINEM